MCNYNVHNISFVVMLISFFVFIVIVCLSVHFRSNNIYVVICEHWNTVCSTLSFPVFGRFCYFISWAAELGVLQVGNQVVRIQVYILKAVITSHINRPPGGNNNLTNVLFSYSLFYNLNSKKIGTLCKNVNTCK